MDNFNIIIDRVATTNVFNLIQGRIPTRDTHLQTIVDDDMVEEFLSEIERFGRISSNVIDERHTNINLSTELRRIGETFFLQFFPESIQKKLRHSMGGFLFLHVDQSLKNIPFELLHDGNCFLADKFFIGKNISGIWTETSRPEREKLKVLIVADPTEDLEWARKEGEGLFESLNAEVSADLIDLEFLSGGRINKLNLLNAMKEKDIIHYAGHLLYSSDQQESGWLLAEGKVLRAREIEKAGLAPDLVFSNSCLSIVSGPENLDQGKLNDLASAFLRAGISTFIGTNWEIKDNARTYDFALHFYRALFDEKSVGEALFDARMHARRAYPAFDLTWANYVMHGNPMARIFRRSNRRTFDASRSILNARRIVSHYPTPIAIHYGKFLEIHQSAGAEEILRQLILTFEMTLYTVGAILFGNYRYLSMKGDLPLPDEDWTLRSWTDKIYECLATLSSVHIELAASGLLESMYLHREGVGKLLGWYESYCEGHMSEDSYDSHSVTFQYLLDNLLHDLSFLRRSSVLYIPEHGQVSTLFRGKSVEEIRIVPEEFKAPDLFERMDANRGKVCYYNSSRSIIFSLQWFVQFTGQSLIFPACRASCIGENAKLEKHASDVEKV